MKSKYLALIASAIAALSISGCKKKTEDVKVYEDFDFRGAGYLENDYFATKDLYKNLSVGQTNQIEVSSFPVSYASTSVNYTSLNPSVATVSPTGLITGVSKGITDVKVEAKDGSFSQRVRVAVSEAVSKTGAKTVIDSISSAYETKEAPTKVCRYEYSYEYYMKEGQIDHGLEGYEAMGFDEEEGYFFVEGPSAKYRTVGGTPEVSDGKWIMYAMNDGLMTRLVHITPTVRNYFDMNTANYMDMGRIIKDILNFFFVSGEKILNDLMEDYHGAKLFSSLTSYSSTEYGSISNDSLHFKVVESGSDTVDYDDEINYMDIPTDTAYTYDFTESVLNSGANTKAMAVNMVMSYKIGEENWQRRFNRSQIFDNDFEHFKLPDNPKDSGYKLVDSLYDL